MYYLTSGKASYYTNETSELMHEFIKEFVLENAFNSNISKNPNYKSFMSPVKNILCKWYRIIRELMKNQWEEVNMR